MLPALIPTAPVSVSVRPRYLRVDVGSPARFACVVSGFPVRGGVTWLRNGRQISPGQSGGEDEKVALSRDGTVRRSGALGCVVGQWRRRWRDARQM